jgi:hypothetical protein
MCEWRGQGANGLYSHVTVDCTLMYTCQQEGDACSCYRMHLLYGACSCYKMHICGWGLALVNQCWKMVGERVRTEVGAVGRRGTHCRRRRRKRAGPYRRRCWRGRGKGGGPGCGPDGRWDFRKCTAGEGVGRGLAVLEKEALGWSGGAGCGQHERYSMLVQL